MLFTKKQSEVKENVKKYQESTRNDPQGRSRNGSYRSYHIILEKIFSEKNFKITPEKIQDFVKCRNDSTHANSVWLTEEVAKTAYCLKALIYINFFKRIGLSEEEIFKAIEWFF